MEFILALHSVTMKKHQDQHNSCKRDYLIGAFLQFCRVSPLTMEGAWWHKGRRGAGGWPGAKS